MSNNPLNQMQKRFNVIIAAYNVENYIEKAVKSVENQTFKNFEIIVVNDCSTDKTREKILQLCSEYSNIKYIENNVNKKAGASRNIALKKADAEYIVFLDADDYLASNDVLEKLDRAIGKEKTDVIFLGFQMVGAKEKLVMPTLETMNNIEKYPNPWSKCWRLEHLNQNHIRFPEERYYEDVLFVYNGVTKAKTKKIVDFVVHCYVKGRKDSITTKITIKNVEDIFANIKDLLEIKSKNPTPAADRMLKAEVAECGKHLDYLIEEMYGN